MTTTKLDREGVGARAAESLVVMPYDDDVIHYKVQVKLDKYDRATLDACREAMGLDHEPNGLALAEWGAVPYETVEALGNTLTRLGRKRLIDRLVGTASNQAMDATHTRIGVGDGSTAAADTDTDLSAAAGSTHRQFVVLDSAPTVGAGASSGVMTDVATFTTGLANFATAWNEWGLDGGTANGTTVTADTNTTPGLFNRRVVNLGIKTSAAAWVFTITITIT